LTLSRVRQHWEGLTPVQKIAVGTLFVAISFELTAWTVFPFNGYDSFSHIFWIDEWHRLWQDGIYYPRWLPDSFHGFGAPSFYYYPPLAFFFSSACYAFLTNLSPDTIGKILGILAFAFSATSMFFYLRWRSTNERSVTNGNSGIIFAALLYTFAPYRIFNYSTRGALPEHLALAFVPLVFWGADLILQRRQAQDIRRGMALLILSFALLLLTNLPAAAVVGIGGFLYVALASKQTTVRDLGRLLFAVFISVLLTAFYVLPVIAMFGNVQLERLWRPVPFVQSSPFLALFTGEALTINSYTFIMLAGACLLWIGWLRTRYIRTRYIRTPLFWLVTFIIAAQLPLLTQYLYRYIFPFTIVQLASRFSILLLVVMAIAWQEEFRKNSRLKQVPIVSIVVAFWSMCTVVLVGLQLADVHVHKHGPLPIGDAPEYATRWAKPYYGWGDSLSAPFENNSRNIVWPSNDSVSLYASIREPYSDTIDYAAHAPSQALIRRSYWPTWKASVDGKSIATSADNLGRLTLTVPEGKHRLILWLETSRAAETGSWISLCTLVTLIIGWIVFRKSKSPKSSA
jgi:hypothetical protein